MADDKKQKTLFLDDAAPPPPAAGAPLSNQKTMMLDSAAPAAAPRPVVVPTMMKHPPSQPLPPLSRPRPPSTWGRWVAGPLLAAGVAAATVFVAGRVMPRPARGATVQKPQGRLRVNTEPPGASIFVDGKRVPHFTPTVIEGDVGATLKLRFSMDGFQPQDAEVYVGAGEHAFAVKLKPVAAPPAPVTAPAPPPPPLRHEHHAPRVKEPVGTATISVFVRPWAIVFVDKQRLRQTPVQGYQIPSGKHTIELVNEGKNRREKIELNLKPGETQEIRRDWDK